MSYTLISKADIFTAAARLKALAHIGTNCMTPSIVLFSLPAVTLDLKVL